MSVLERIIHRHALLRDRGEIHAKDGSWVLSWHRGYVRLTDSPATSVKDPRRALDPDRKAKAVRWTWDTTYLSQAIRYPIWTNVMDKSGIKISDSTQQVKAKIEKSYEGFLDFLRTKGPEAVTYNANWIDEVKAWLSGASRSYPDYVNWYKDYVAPAEFVPKSMKPIKAKGKDFEITVAANKFTVYSRYETYPSGDDSYSGYESKSPAAARKFYLLLTKNPQALETVTMNDFSNWLRQNKIPFDYLSSSWR